MPKTMSEEETTFSTTERIMVAALYCKGIESLEVFEDDTRSCCWTFELTPEVKEYVTDFAMDKMLVSPQDFHRKWNQVRNEQRVAARDA